MTTRKATARKHGQQQIPFGDDNQKGEGKKDSVDVRGSIAFS
jgi:hypothetical protein